MTVKSFLDDIRMASTRTSYVTGICTFIHFIYCLPPIKGKRRTKEEREIYFKKCDEYLEENRNYGDDLIAFIKNMNEKHCSPQLINVNTTAVKGFLIHHRIILDEFDLRRVKKIKPPLGPVKRKYDISHEEIRKILTHTHITLKLIILILVSSGARIDEVLTLTLKDVELHDNYGIIYISRENTNTKKQRYSFISQEAVEILKEYIRKEGKKDNDRLFDFTYENANYMFNLALKNAGLDGRNENINTRKISFHIFRVYFLSQMKLVISPEIPEMLAGHEGYLTQNYRNYPQKQALEEYLKAVKMVTFEMPQDVREMQTKFEKELAENTQLVKNLVIENQQLKQQVRTIADTVAQLYKLRDSIQDTMAIMPPEIQKKISDGCRGNG
ncbi:tyrosine-type recombinase/integrase [Methanoregula sp.]|jgi:integrase|uniref:tyrosine-type recombinase/integrase n=1 Tax=Methanoregula sp. TaxID=2052170 RepID=UPI0025FB6D33|nr:site-specific integrase [Methanoregula sp.]